MSPPKIFIIPFETPCIYTYMRVTKQSPLQGRPNYASLYLFVSILLLVSKMLYIILSERERERQRET